MRSDAAEESVAAYDALGAVLDRIEALSLEALTSRRRLKIVERHETAAGASPAC